MADFYARNPQRRPSNRSNPQINPNHDSLVFVLDADARRKSNLGNFMIYSNKTQSVKRQIIVRQKKIKFFVKDSKLVT